MVGVSVMALSHTFQIIAGLMGSQSLPPIPAGTFTGRDSPDVVASSTDSDTATDGGLASATARVTLTLSRSSNGFLITVSSNAGDSRYWWNTSNVASALTSTPVTIYTNTNVVPTAIKLDSGSWVSTPSNGTSTAITHEETAEAEGVGYQSNSSDLTITCWGRASGYADTILATFIVSASATAESTCFIGESLVTMSDYSTKRIDSVALGDFVLGQDGIINEVVNIRTTDINSTIYGFNGTGCFVTAGHPFLTTAGWKSLDVTLGQAKYPDLNITQLEVGDTLVKFNTDTQQYYEEQITSIEQESVQTTVYNLNVSGSDTPDKDGNDTYVVNGHVVHNK
jgi:hypothetical protein